MSSLNKAMIIGNLGADPEVRYTQSNTAVATLSVATSERYKDSNGDLQERTEWHRVVAWGKLAEICQSYLKKGSKVYLEGPIQTRSWEDKDGQKKYTTEIKALNMVMLDRKDDSMGGGDSGYSQAAAGSGAMNSGKQNSTSASPTTFNNNDLDNVEDDLPF
ncbi:MAG: single-stranded DNA-binding protein [Balneolales bacterium]|nr:single-stranded DNA-binding protein [Balneolales bacterium]